MRSGNGRVKRIRLCKDTCHNFNYNIHSMTWLVCHRGKFHKKIIMLGVFTEKEKNIELYGFIYHNCIYSSVYTIIEKIAIIIFCSNSLLLDFSPYVTLHHHYFIINILNKYFFLTNLLSIWISWTNDHFEVHISREELSV